MQLACIVFRAGERPDADAVARLAQATDEFSIVPDSGGDGWVELLRDGLTFDLVGLAPGAGAVIESMPRRYGLPETAAGAGFEALALRLGPHLAGAERLLPVVRTVAGVAMELSGLPGVEAVGWLPSHSLCNPAWFRAGVSAWLDGGPFPSLALSGLERAEDGMLHSHGLAFLTGQEFALAPGCETSPQDDGHTAIRLTDWLVANGSVTETCEVELVGIGPVRLEPEPDGLLLARRA